MDAIPLISTIGGALIQGFGASQQAAQNKAAYEYQAQVDRNNAMIAEWNAKDIARRGEQDIIDQQRRTAALMGSQRATFASRGIDLSEGSALNILSDTEYMGEQDILTIKDNTAKNVWAAQIEKNNHLANAQLKKMQADNQNPLMAGATSLLSNAGSVSNAWYQYKGKGK